MRHVGTLEAKNQLSALLDLVEQGEDVLITRHGKPVARLVAAADNQLQKNATLAAERIRARAKAQSLGRFDWDEWKAYRDEGRR